MLITLLVVLKRVDRFRFTCFKDQKFHSNGAMAISANSSAKKNRHSKKGCQMGSSLHQGPLWGVFLRRVLNYIGDPERKDPPPKKKMENYQSAAG